MPMKPRLRERRKLNTYRPNLFGSYKKLALKWHPKLSKENPDLTYHTFCEISEAYEVLGDRKLH